VKPPDWVHDAIFYQVFPERFRNGEPSCDPPGARPWGELPRNKSHFGGDLVGVREGLGHIQALGANTLYLTPVFTAPSNHKYDTEDYHNVDRAFGGNRALAELIRDVHARSMRIVLDAVLNHCGETHPFFRDVVDRGRRSPYWDWFTVRGDHVVRDPEPNYACWAGVRSMPEWNHANPEVRDYLLSIVRHWLHDWSIDGWRLDTVEYLPPDFVRDVRQATKEENPDAYVLGEVMGIATSWFRHGAVDGVMHYKLWEALVGFVADRTLDGPGFAGFVRAMWRSYPRENAYACYTLLSSHDKPRFRTLSGGDVDRLRLGAALLFALPGAPAVFYGDEVGMEGGHDPDCRRCFPWGEGDWDRETLELFSLLTSVRGREPVLRRGTLTPGDCQGRVASFIRDLDGQQAVVAGNAGEREGTASLPGAGPWRDALSGELLRTSRIALPPQGFKILLEGAGTT